DFVEWFIRRIFNTPHSTKQIEDALGWAHETDAETLLASTVADMAAPATRREQLALARRVRCPVSVITAPDDKTTAPAEASALVPDLHIDWLPQHPVTRVLQDEGEHIHPASQHLASESRHIECESAEHDLHCFQAWRRMDEILVSNFMVFHDLVRDRAYDLW